MGTEVVLVRFLDGGQIACAAYSTFLIRDLTTSTDVLSFEYDGRPCAISSDGTRLLSTRGSASVVKIWQTDNTSRNQRSADHHTAMVNCISFSKDGQLVASGSYDNTAKIWDTSTGRCVTTFRGHSGIVDLVLFSPDSTICASYGWDNVIRIWDVQTGNSVSTRHAGMVRCMCFSPNGSQLAYLHGIEPKEVKLWDVATGDHLASMQVKDSIISISFNVDETSLILNLGYKEEWWRIISSTPTSFYHDGSDADSNYVSIDESYTSSNRPLPKFFSYEQDQQPQIQPEISLHHYRHDHGAKSPWVMDRQGRRVLWAPTDSREMSDCNGKKVVFGSRSGVVTIVEFPT